MRPEFRRRWPSFNIPVLFCTYILAFGAFLGILSLFSANFYTSLPALLQKNNIVINTLSSNVESPCIAIIIDDFGQGRDGVNEMMSINQHLTFAVIPFLAFSEKDAENAYQKGFEVIAHIPLESKYGKRNWLGPNPILNKMNHDDAFRITGESIDAIPHAVGANIHMGSLASGNRDIVSGMLNAVKQKNQYFVDSKTSKAGYCKTLALEAGVPFIERDVFLDGQKPESFIVDRLRKTMDIAQRSGKAVAIGHVGKEGGKVTAHAILSVLPEMEKKGIKLVYVSELLNKK